MAASIKEKLGIESVLKKGTSGVFEVILDGDLLFSKKALGRFPEDGEVEAAIAGRAAS